MAGQTIAVDAMFKIYQAGLGLKTVNALTDSSGNPTVHVNAIVFTVAEMRSYNITPVWVFDYLGDDTEEFHNPAKLHELMRRRKRREEVILKIDTMTIEDLKRENAVTFDTPADKDVEHVAEAKQAAADNAARLNSLHKQRWRPTPEMIADIKIILNCLRIPYVESPYGYEGEAIASYLNAKGIVDGVYSGDSDPIAYGAPRLYRISTRDKLIYEYTQEDIINQVSEYVEGADLGDIRKIAMIMGTDMVAKTPKIGPKTVMKKFNDIDLTDAQIVGMCEFTKMDTAKPEFKIHNQGAAPYNASDAKELIDWLVEVKSFSRDRMEKLFAKSIDGSEKRAAGKPVRKTPAKAAKSRGVGLDISIASIND